MISVDTGAWFALAVEADANHNRADEWLGENSLPLITTDYVVCETLTLLRARRETQRAIEVGRKLIEGHGAELHFLTPQEFHRASALSAGYLGTHFWPCFW